MADTKRKAAKAADSTSNATPQAEATAPAPVAAVAKSPAKRATGSAKKPAADRKENAEKAKKPKLVRDSFTMPDEEYAVIDALKKRCLASGVAAKKSEILRAGIKALAAMSETKLAAAIKSLPQIKTGRPAKQDR